MILVTFAIITNLCRDFAIFAVIFYCPYIYSITMANIYLFLELVVYIIN